MWIRSQDKTFLKECNDIRLETYKEVENGKETIVYVIVQGSWQYFYNRTLGKYSTEEKALKVLDMIQEEIPKNSFYGINTVFQMPQDNEVNK